MNDHLESAATPIIFGAGAQLTTATIHGRLVLCGGEALLFGAPSIDARMRAAYRTARHVRYAGVDLNCARDDFGLSQPSRAFANLAELLQHGAVCLFETEGLFENEELDLVDEGIRVGRVRIFDASVGGDATAMQLATRCLRERCPPLKIKNWLFQGVLEGEQCDAQIWSNFKVVITSIKSAAHARRAIARVCELVREYTDGRVLVAPFEPEFAMVNYKLNLERSVVLADAAEHFKRAGVTTTLLPQKARPLSVEMPDVCAKIYASGKCTIIYRSPVRGPVRDAKMQQILSLVTSIPAWTSPASAERLDAPLPRRDAPALPWRNMPRFA